MFDKAKLDKLDKLIERAAKLLKVGVTILISIGLLIGLLALIDQLNDAKKLALCHQAAACKKYSKVRQECATAGSFKTCLRIKMGDDAYLSRYVQRARRRRTSFALATTNARRD
jgi:hypothetical protein